MDEQKQQQHNIFEQSSKYKVDDYFLWVVYTVWHLCDLYFQLWGQPVRERSLFIGRTQQLDQLVWALSRRLPDRDVF